MTLKLVLVVVVVVVVVVMTNPSGCVYTGGGRCPDEMRNSRPTGSETTTSGRYRFS